MSLSRGWLAGLFALCACNPAAVRTPSQVANAPLALPVAARSQAPRTMGLVLQLSDDKHHVQTTTATPHFTLGAGESLHPGVAPDFTAVWTAQLNVPEAGAYNFSVEPADVIAEATIDGKPMVWGQVTALSQGPHPFSLSYKRKPGPVRLQLRWSGEAFVSEPMPASVFTPHDWSSEGERWQTVDEGRALYDELGCRGCHQRAGDDPHVDNFYHITRRGRGPGLSRVGRRLSPAWVYAFLQDPRSHRANTKMPKVLHTKTEVADVAAFLNSLQEVGANTSGDHPPWAEPPLLPEEKLAAETLYNSIGCSACHGNEANKVSLAAVGSKYEPYALIEYMMRPDNFDHSGRMPGMLRGDEGKLLARWLLTNRKPALEVPPPSGGDVARGRSLVETRGCLGCHSIDLAGLQVFTALQASPFERLPAQRKGCLSQSAQHRYADYELSDRQWEALVAYLQEKEVAPSPLWELARTLDSRGCRNCHETDVPAHSTLPEIPPSLRDVGNKLRPDWIARQLSGASRLRPWYGVRMPRFHRADALGALFAAAAGEPTTLPKVIPLAEPGSRAVQEGVQYLGKGEGGMSCVTCHRYATFDPKSATPAPDLSTAAERLRPTWFKRWLSDPLRLAPGTQMPAFFSGVDESFASARINAIWTALTLGKKMPAPDGVDLSAATMPYPLHDKPVVVRTFLEGSGPRTLAVGFKNGAYAFDAEVCKLMYTWTGGFLDMRPVWVGHGGDMATPIGSVAFRAGKTPLFRIGDGSAKPLFKGYRLATDGAHLQYDLGGVAIEDYIRPARDGFARSVRLRAGKTPADVALNLDPQVTLVSPKAPNVHLAKGATATVELFIANGAVKP